MTILCCARAYNVSTGDAEKSTKAVELCQIEEMSISLNDVSY